VPNDRAATQEMKMGLLGRVGALVAVLAVLAVGCGGSEGATEDVGVGGETGDATSQTVAGGGGTEDTGVIITVDGVEHVVDTSLGGKCTTDGDPSYPDTELAAFGYDQDGGRVELTFRHQGADTSVSGKDEYFGSVSTLDGHWQMQTVEPFSWLDGDRSHVTGTATMEDSDGQTVEVGYDVQCP
jgi:hypothetical protein